MFLRLALVAFLGLAMVACGSSGTGDDPDGSTPGGDGGTGTDGTTGTDGGTLEKFSFFVTSLKALRQLSGSQNGFGGDLRYGETGNGAGLKGADKICSAIAETSMPGAGTGKTWRAFLSASVGESGTQVNAIDRIGDGPWYDRLGRQLASTRSTLMATRPTDADTAIKNDFPNEDGVPNHNPDGTGQVDNHDMLTGSNTSGQLYGASATCLDWTAATGATTEGSPRVGHSWPRTGGGGGGPGGPGGEDPNHWMSSLTESGCKPGVNLVETGGPNPSARTVGSGGGYGGFYCFATTP
jgi:hypothetical protein